MTKQEAPNNEDRGSRSSKLRLAPPRPLASDDEEQTRSSKRNGSKNQSGLSLAPPLLLSQRNQRSEQQDWWPSGWSQGDSSAVEDTDSSMPSSIGHELGPGAHRIAGTEGGIGNDDLSSAWTSTVSQNGVEVTNGALENRPPEEQMPPVEGVLVPNREETRANMLNSAVEADDVQIVGLQKKQRRTWITAGVVMVALILAAIGATLGVVLRGGGGGASSAVEAPTPAPTAPPTPTPTSPRFVEVESLVLNLFGTVLDDRISPQYRAAEWLADVDTTFDLSDEERFRQRYAVAVFYFATGGDTNWIHQMNFLSPGVHECNWHERVEEHVVNYGTDKSGVFCSGGFGGSELIDTFLMLPNNMMGYLPDEMGALASVNALVIAGQNLQGSITPSIFELTDLQFLQMPFINFTGTIPTEIGQLTNLVQLWFQDASFDSTIPSEIGNLSNLQLLSLKDSLLYGTLPETVLQMPSLLGVSLDGNDWTGTLPDSFPLAWPKLDFLNLRNNNFTGTIPQNIGELSLLEVFSLDGNAFTGPFPESLADLPLLNDLRLARNDLTGSLPSVFNMPRLQVLLLQENMFTGNVPPSIGSLTMLEYLSFLDNRFAGTLPAELGNLTSVIWLDLSENDFTGVVPESFQQLQSLEFLFVITNRLEGDLSFLCNGSEYLFPEMFQFWADCLGEVVCPCCNFCCDSQDACEYV